MESYASLCSEPSWVKELAEECQQLRESNEFLHLEVSYNI